MVRISENINLANYTSFGAHATATRLVEWSSVEELLAYLTSSEGRAHLADRWTILGEGCNTLFTKDFLGTVIRSTAKGIEVINEDNNHLTDRKSTRLNSSHA